MDLNSLLTRRNIVVGSLLLFILVAIFLILTTPLYHSVKVYKTPFTTSNFATLQGEHIYSYNGLAFIKTDPDDSRQITVLHGGTRLPEIEKLVWAGDGGAFMQFSESGFIDSAVQGELNTLGKTWNDTTQQYLWYFDFKTAKLHLVDEQVASSELFYSASSEGLYYIGYGDIIPESDQVDGLPLLFYSAKTHEKKTLLSDVGDATAISYIGICIDTKTICAAQQGQENNSVSLWSVTNDAKKPLLNESFSAIIPTASPQVFIGTKDHETRIAEESEDEMLQSDTYRIDVVAQKVQKLGAVVNAGATRLANIGSKDIFYLLDQGKVDSGDTTSYFAGANDLLGTPKTMHASFQQPKENSSLPKGIIGPFSRSSTGLALFNDVSDATYLVSPDSLTPSFVNLPPQDTEKALEPCFKTHTSYHDYTDEIRQYKVGITYDSAFKNKIRAFSDCVVKANPNVLVSYSFIFVGLDAKNGKFVTD